MSKSDECDNSRINLTDNADTIAQKIRKARTDPDPLPHSDDGLKDRPEAENLINIYAALADETPERVIADRRPAIFRVQEGAGRSDRGQAHADRGRNAPSCR